MAKRKPIVLIDGKKSEIGLGDWSDLGNDRFVCFRNELYICKNALRKIPVNGFLHIFLKFDDRVVDFYNTVKVTLDNKLKAGTNVVLGVFNGFRQIRD